MDTKTRILIVDGRRSAAPLVELLNTAPVPEADAHELMPMVNALPEGTDAPARLIVPFGDVPYNRDGIKGIQRLDRRVADRMVELWNSLQARALRFSRGAPIYEGGHPDYRPQPGATEPPGCGRIRSLEAGDEALSLVADWGATGLQALANKAWAFFSPYFLGVKVGEEGGQAVYEPMYLKSVGLTNSPNWDVVPIINSDGVAAVATPKGGSMDLLQRLLALIGRDEVKTDDDVVSSVQKLIEAVKKIREASDAEWAGEAAAREALANTADDETFATDLLRVVGESFAELTNSVGTHSTRAGELETQLTTITADRDAHRLARAEALVNTAIEGGRVVVGQKDTWLESLVNAADFAAEAAKLAGLQAVVPAAGDPPAGDLDGRESEVRANSRKFIGLVNAHMEETGQAYEDAFSAMKDAHPELLGVESKKEGGE